MDKFIKNQNCISFVCSIEINSDIRSRLLSIIAFPYIGGFAISISVSFITVVSDDSFELSHNNENFMRFLENTICQISNFSTKRFPIFNNNRIKMGKGRRWSPNSDVVFTYYPVSFKLFIS